MAGMLGLTMEERGAYNTLIDLLYARDGDVPNDDYFMARAQQCRPHRWRRVRDSLIAKGKVHITPDGKLMTKRVLNEISNTVQFQFNQKSRAKKRWKTMRVVNSGNAITTTTIKESSFPEESQSIDPSVDNSRPSAIRAAPKGPSSKRGWNGSRDYQSPSIDDLRRTYAKPKEQDDDGGSSG